MRVPEQVKTYSFGAEPKHFMDVYLRACKEYRKKGFVVDNKYTRITAFRKFFRDRLFVFLIFILLEN